MRFENHSSKWMGSLGRAFLATTVLAAPALHAQKELEAPKIVQFSSDHGAAQPAAQQTITVHLNMRNQAAFDKAVDALYTPGSPTYHQWMTKSDLTKYGPTQQDVEAVKKELKSQGLSVLSVSADNLSIRARGSVSSLETAFQTQIHELERNGKTFNANVTPAKLTGEAGSLVSSVTGLTAMNMRSHIVKQIDVRSGKARPFVSVPKAGTSLSSLFTNVCFPGPQSFTTSNPPNALPIGQYYGNTYVVTDTKSCGWTPSQVSQYYGLSSSGLDGTGQTIVIVDGPTDGVQLKSDLTTFSSLTGLPAPTSSNFEVLYPDGQPSQLSLETDNWQDESSLDVEWAHGIAPKAKIVILIMPTEDWTEFEFAIQYAMDNKLGNVISNSYGLPEQLWGKSTADGFNQVLETAAAAGLTVNFSSGDGGDEGTGAPNAGGDSCPACSPYATSVGGTSLGIPSPTTPGKTLQVGWGNNITYMAFSGIINDPPVAEGFIGGAGGGESGFFAKPSWQKSLPGTGRQQPDVAGPADSFTGAVLVLDGQVGVIGGTSWASPVFSAIWSLAMQKAGKPLGQAAPLITNIHASMYDIVPVSSPTNPAGVIFDSNGATYYSQTALAAPLYSTTQFYGAIPTINPDDLTFGTDSSLTVTAGWDNVTGWGVPWGTTFINAAAAAK
jgi:subtilase family serine protease